MIQAGKLNEQITFQTKTTTPDSAGYHQPGTWTDYKTVWAEVMMTGGGEFYAAQKVNAETNAVFRIRQRSDITTSMRVKWGSRYFEILYIALVGRNEAQISGKEVV